MRLSNSDAVALIDEADLPLLAGRSWFLKRGRNNAVAVVSAWRVDGRDGVRQVHVQLHRFLLGLGPNDKLLADHIDGNTLNNQRSNLRVATNAQNAQNRHGGRGISGFRGVYRTPGGRWEARSQVDGKRHSLGSFDAKIDAALAVEEFRKQHMPFAQIDPALLEAEMAA